MVLDVELVPQIRGGAVDEVFLNPLLRRADVGDLAETAARPHHRHRVAVDQHRPRIRVGVAQDHPRRTLHRDAAAPDERPGQQRRRRRFGEARGQRLQRVVDRLALRVEIVERVWWSRRRRGREPRRQHARCGERGERVTRAAPQWNAHRRNGNVRPVRDPVRVAGLGVVSVFGTALDAFRDALLEGRSGIVPVKGFDTSGCRSTIAAEIAGFDPTPWVPPMKMRRMDRTAVYTVAATRLALDDAGVAISVDGDDRKGVMLGTWTAGGGSTQHFLDALFKQGPTGAP